MTVFQIARYETLKFAVRSSTPALLAGYAVLAAYFLFSLLGTFNGLLNQYLAMPYGAEGMLRTLSLNHLVIEPYFHTLVILLVFIFPILSMGMIAGEREGGTMEMLTTSPVSSFQLVIGKFLSLLFFSLVIAVISAAFPAVLFVYADPQPELFPVLTGITGIFLCGAVFSSIGLMFSCIMKTQAAAASSTFVILILMYSMHSFFESFSFDAYSFSAYSLLMQLGFLFKGVVVLSGIIFLFSLVVTGLFISVHVMNRLRGSVS